MTTGPEPPDSHAHRATDGLDWTRSAPPVAPAGPAAEAPPDRDVLTSQPPGNGRQVGLGALAGIAALTALVAGLIAGAMVSYFDDDAAARPSASPTNRALLSVDQTSAISDVAAKARPGVVRIESSRRTNSGLEQDVGSGIVLDAEGHILTNAHVVLGTDTLHVILSDGSDRPAILLGHDFPFTDIAVLAISPGKLTPIAPGDSSAVKLGQTVIAIGNPLAEFDGSVSVGVISGIDRRRTFDAVRQDDLLQTDAAVNNGNSGGALLNLEGQFIGVPTAVLRQSRGGLAVEGIAFALPSNRAMQIANRIIAEGGNYPRPSLGAEVADITAEVAQRFPRLAVTQGGLVSSVVSAGPADVAGLQPGDIVTAVGGHNVNRDNPFLNALLAFEPGQSIKVVLNRNGRIIEAEVRLARRS